MEQLINEALEQAYGGLNPKFSMERTTRHIARTQTSTRRRKNVERMGVSRRILDMKEEMGVHAYMKRNNLCGQNLTQDEANNVVNKFFEET